MRQKATALLKQLTMLLDLLYYNKNSFCHLLSDYEKNMVVAGTILKSVYPKLFRVTCVAHLLPNCVMKANYHFDDVDQLIAKSNQQQLKTKPDQPNSQLLVARLDLL